MIKNNGRILIRLMSGKSSWRISVGFEESSTKTRIMSKYPQERNERHLEGSSRAGLVKEANLQPGQLWNWTLVKQGAWESLSTVTCPDPETLK